MNALHKMLLDVGVTPRSEAELMRRKHWRELMVPPRELARRQERIEEFKQLRQQFTPPVPADQRKFLGPEPSPAASRLVGRGMLDFGDTDQPGKTE